MKITWIDSLSSTRAYLARNFLLAGSLCFGTALLSPSTFAQSPANNPNEMCGDGTTFTVNLPGTGLGIDDSDGIFRAVTVPPVGPPDSVTLPNGCSLYVLLVSGYHQNENFDRITFFKVADFVAKNNGYVHVAWWNNMLKEYMGGVLHQATITIQRFILLPDTIDVNPNPGGYDLIQTQALLFPSDSVDLPKANPDENFQFVSDATLTIQAIKANNPNALIVLIGHSLGADSVAWVGRNSQLPIDLLALIDPANSRDLPRGPSGALDGTRWRATHDFAGYKRWDCVRGPLGLCKNFGTFFHPSFRCVPSGDFLDRPPLLTPTLAPIVCPIFLPFADPGTVRTIQENVKHLYFRWQHEYFYPLDFLADYNYNYPAPLSSSILDPNYQQPILKNGLLQNGFEEDPNKTCGDPLAYDPRRSPGFACSPFDGHGEIVGFRAPQNDLLNPLQLNVEGLGLVMQNWPADAAGRRAKMIEMTTADASWPQRPVDPDLCMVCDDIIAIMQNLINQQGGSAQDTTSPTTVATANPGPNVNGWNMQDVLVNLHAADNAGGSGVQAITYSAAGAQTISSTTLNAASASFTVNTEGITTTTFSATDNAGNVELPKTLVIQLDKTPPTITSSASPVANGNGWNNTNVTVSFQCSDALSGLAAGSPPPPTVLSAEGAGQSVSGSCQDLAGNVSGSMLSIDIDKTPPTATANASPGPNASGWNNTNVTVSFNGSDNLSGIASCSAPVSLANDGANQSASGTCTDNAGNVSASASATGINIDKTPPTLTFAAAAPAANANGWNNSNVSFAFTASDSLSGVAGTSVPSPVVLSAEGTSVTGSVTVTDKAGNTATFTTPAVKIDKTPPTATASASPGPNASGWNNTNVTVSFNGSDNLSGIASCSAPVTLANDGANQSASGTCTDNAGNVSASASATGINIDKTPPVLTMPAFAPSYLLNSTLTLNFGATDALSGLATMQATLNGTPVTTGTTVTLTHLATNTFTLTATDVAGNISTQKATFAVIYNFIGFLPPIPNDGSGLFKLGSTVPVKFQLTDANGSLISTAVAHLTIQMISNNALVGTPIDASGPGNADVGNLFRFDGTQYIFNWSTAPVSTGTWQLQALLDDGTVHAVVMGTK